MRQKKGQFFLIAAVVIIVVVVSIVTISNYIQKKDIVKLYDLGEELGIESQQVLDYGTYNELNDTEMKTLMENFIENYVSYLEEDKNIYFIFGNKQKINIIGYQEIAEENVTVCFEASEGCTPYLTIGETQEFTKEGGEDIYKVVIRIASIDYEFRLKQGENFYFIIWQKIGEETHVITSEEEQQGGGTSFPGGPLLSGQQP